MLFDAGMLLSSSIRTENHSARGHRSPAQSSVLSSFSF